MVWPDNQKEWNLKPVVSLARLEEEVQSLFLNLDELAFSEKEKPILLEFDSSAQSLFDDWQTNLECRLRQGRLPFHMEAHLAKYKKLVPSLSLIFHYLNTGEDRAYIDRANLGNAILWAEYLESHAEKIYHSGANESLKGAHGLIRHIQQGDVQEPFSVRDVYQGHHWSGLSTPQEVEEAVALLCEKNHLVPEMVKTGERTSTKYWVHPDLFKNT